jgi:predicted metal-dependent hydrolase
LFHFSRINQGIQDLGTGESQQRMLFEGLEVSVRWSRRRRSIGLKVTADGRLLVMAPQGASEEVIYQVVAQHRDWIDRKLAAARQAWAPLQAAGQVFFLGQSYHLALSRGQPERVEMARKAIRVSLADGKALWPLLQQWYRRQAEQVLPERVRHFAGRLGQQVQQVELRDWKRRWGECQPGWGGLLRFNWRLIMLPLKIVDYVVVHELAHLRQPGHQARFWQLVAEILPDYAHRRFWLNHYGSPFLLWQASEAQEG